MKILTITSHISANALPCFQRNKTGFGYMVHDIISAIAMKEKMDVLVYYYRYKEQNIDGAHYIGCSFWSIIRCLFMCLSVSIPFQFFRKYRMDKSSALRLFYCWMLTGYYRHIIRNGNYDVVHIHGAGFNNELWMQLCQKMGQRYVVTLHGLNSFSNSIKIDESGKRYERDFLNRAVNGEFPITVISSGIKRIIEDTYKSDGCKNIFIVLNAFSFIDRMNVDEVIDVRKHYGIAPDAKIVLYVGNISANKNQVQMARAFDLMKESVKNNTYILFLGNHQERDGGLYDTIARSKYKNHLILCGGIEKEQMPAYYEAADGVVLLSHAEGFGLGLAEGMHFGLPCVTFTDLDAFPDLYDSNVMIPIPSRRDEDVADSIERLLSLNWDKYSIISFAKKFEKEKMAENYINVFRSLIEK